MIEFAHFYEACMREEHFNADGKSVKGDMCHEPPNEFGGLRTDISVWRFASPIVSSLSIQFLRQGRADAPLARSWDRRMHLQFAALPFRVNSPAGVGAVL